MLLEQLALQGGERLVSLLLPLLLQGAVQRVLEVPTVQWQWIQTCCHRANTSSSSSSSRMTRTMLRK
jgi:hypothetical protein